MMKHLSQVDQGHNIRLGIVGSSLKVVDDNGETYKNREVIVSIAKIDGVVSILFYFILFYFCVDL